MTPQNAITELRTMQHQIIHGPSIFGNIADLVETLQMTLADLNSKVHSGYDFNSDPDRVTMRVGMLLPNTQADLP